MKNGSKRISIINKDENESTFWNLSFEAHVPALVWEVMAVLWTMRAPERAYRTG